MKILFDTMFKQFSGKSDTGVIKLTQAMGGGKTHNMLALALLAQNPDWRRKLVGHEYDDIGEIKVVAFSGHESDADYGIWGSIAEQLGRKEFFADHYTPLKAPVSEFLQTEQVHKQVTEQVERLLAVLGDKTLSAKELLERLGLKHRQSFKQQLFASRFRAWPN